MAGAIQNPAGAQGTSAADNVFQEITDAVSVAAIATRRVPVELGVTAAGVLQATVTTTGSVPARVRGICLDTATAAGQIVRVCTKGYVRGVACESTVAKDDLLGRSATTNARVNTVATPTVGLGLAVALTAAVSLTCDVWVVG